MAENKTKPTAIDPKDYVAAIDDPVKRADSIELMDLMTELTGEAARMWGPTMIGFGSYHYKYESGREGDSFLAGFAPRKSELVVYLIGNIPQQAELLGRLGKHRMGEACLYIKRLDLIDREILRQLITLSIAAIRKKYPSK